jgi:hypothetical protein
MLEITSVIMHAFRAHQYKIYIHIAVPSQKHGKLEFSNPDFLYKVSETFFEENVQV